MQQDFDRTIDQIWEAATRRFPRFSTDEQRAGITLLRRLADGHPVTAEQLAQSLGITTHEAERMILDSGISSFVHTEDGQVQSAFGLSIVPTGHGFTIDDRTLWTWCALDALFLPELLATTAEVESKDPETDEPIHLTVSPTAIASSHPDDIVVSLNSPEAWETTSVPRLIVTACHFIHFFATRESGQRWASRQRDAVLAPLEDAFIYGRRQNARLFGEELARRSSSST